MQAMCIWSSRFRHRPRGCRWSCPLAPPFGPARCTSHVARRTIFNAGPGAPSSVCPDSRHPPAPVMVGQLRQLMWLSHLLQYLFQGRLIWRFWKTQRHQVMMDITWVVVGHPRRTRHAHRNRPSAPPPAGPGGQAPANCGVSPPRRQRRALRCFDAPAGPPTECIRVHRSRNSRVEGDDQKSFQWHTGHVAAAFAAPCPTRDCPTCGNTCTHRSRLRAPGKRQCCPDLSRTTGLPRSVHPALPRGLQMQVSESLRHAEGLHGTCSLNSCDPIIVQAKDECRTGRTTTSCTSRLRRLRPVPPPNAALAAAPAPELTAPRRN